MTDTQIVENTHVDTQELALPICNSITLEGGLSLSFIDATLEDVETLQDKITGSDIDICGILDKHCLKETIINGMYSRCVLLPKNTFIIGAMHKAPYVDIMISGDATIKSYFHDGSLEYEDRYTGLNIFEGKPGRKRVLYMHEDTIWMNVDRTTKDNCKDAFDETGFVKSEDYKKEMFQ